MKKRVVLIVGVSAVALCVLWLMKKTPRLENAMLEQNLGAVLARKMVEVPIKNNGGAPLTLKFQSSTCGCVSSVSGQYVIDPYSEGNLTLLVDPVGQGPGQKYQRIVFSTDDPEKPELVLGLFYQTNLHQDVLVAPQSLHFELTQEELRQGKGRSFNQIIFVDQWKDFLTVELLEASPHLSVELMDKYGNCKSCDLHAVRAEVRLLPTLPLGPFSEFVRFSTNHPEYPEIRIPIEGVLKGDLKIQPRALVFSREEEARGDTQEIRIKSREPVEIVAIGADAPWLHAVQDKAASGEDVIRVRVDWEQARPLLELQGMLESTIKLQLKQGVLEQYEVSVFVQ